MESMLRRLKHLEELQEVSVESTLQDIRSLLKSPAFSKDQAFDYLLTLQLVAKEKKHAKAGYYEAILRAMRDKSSVDIDQFKRYLEVLIGDKDQEKVLDLISKVDKAAKRKGSFSESSAAPKRGRGGAGRRAGVQCFHCLGYGHYQSYCPQKFPRRGNGRGRGKAE